MNDFLSELRALMASWGWTPAEVEEALPRFARILITVGILRRDSDGSYRTTALVEDNEAWREAWAKAKEEGIGGTSPAS